MEFKPCAIVPVYHHANTVWSVVKNLKEQNLPVFIVDDGNSPEDLQVLNKVAESFPDVTVISHSSNLGKGAAVSTAMREAHKEGFTHALQIDADGQHHPAAIPFFLKESRRHFKSLIAGFPQYNASVPKSREQGRKITNFWVKIETLSRRVPDAMCGFRIYPILQTMPILENLRSLRMGFDIEILVRLSWAGVSMFSYPVKVNYPEHGISNFRMLHDNIDISWLHTRLCCGMLLRLPKLLVAKKRAAEFRKSRQQKMGEHKWKNTGHR